MKSIQSLSASLTALILCFTSITVFGQEPEKTPEQLASEQADRLQKDLDLADHQVFYIDSVLQYNFTGLTKEMEDMRKAGMQSRDSYMNVQKKWGMKTEEAFEKILDNNQFLKYLKLSGRYRDYKKRKGIK